MHIFISWSGERSRSFAEYLNDWLRKLPLSILTWVSGEAIEPGTRWEKEIAQALEGTRFGILCLTSDNQLEPWICFEAGALAKTIDKTNVVPYLLDFSPSALEQPMKQFHAMEANKEDTWKLIKAIYKISGDQTRSVTDLEDAFEMWWPKLEQKIQDIQQKSNKSDGSDKLTLHDLKVSVDRIASVVESISSRFSKIEKMPAYNKKLSEHNRTSNNNSSLYELYLGPNDLPTQLVIRQLTKNADLEILNPQLSKTERGSTLTFLSSEDTHSLLSKLNYLINLYGVNNYSVHKEGELLTISNESEDVKSELL